MRGRVGAGNVVASLASFLAIHALQEPLRLMCSTHAEGGPTSHGNEAADGLANKGKHCNEMEGVWTHVTASEDYEGIVQFTEGKSVRRRLLQQR